MVRWLRFNFKETVTTVPGLRHYLPTVWLETPALCNVPSRKGLRYILMISRSAVYDNLVIQDHQTLQCLKGCNEGRQAELMFPVRVRESSTFAGLS